jgi:hypothetical protein
VVGLVGCNQLRRGLKEGKVRKLACSRSHGCVARAGSSCRENCFGNSPGGKGDGFVHPLFCCAMLFFRVVTHDEVAVPEHCIPRADSLTPSSAMITTVRRCRVKDHCRNNALNHNPTHQRGIHGTIEEPQMLNPSLTFRVGMAANAQLQKASARDRCRVAKSVTHVSGYCFLRQQCCLLFRECSTVEPRRCGALPLPRIAD